MDLEIWDASGETLLARAYQLHGHDARTRGTESFRFVRYEAGHYAEAYEVPRPLDFSTGQYVVSAYFHENSATKEPVDVLLTVRRPDGSSETRAKTLRFRPGRDQWHAVRIDAATGEVQTLDKYVRVAALE